MEKEAKLPRYLRNLSPEDLNAFAERLGGLKPKSSNEHGAVRAIQARIMGQYAADPAPHRAVPLIQSYRTISVGPALEDYRRLSKSRQALAETKKLNVNIKDVLRYDGTHPEAERYLQGFSDVNRQITPDIQDKSGPFLAKLREHLGEVRDPLNFPDRKPPIPRKGRSKAPYLLGAGLAAAGTAAYLMSRKKRKKQE